MKVRALCWVASQWLILGCGPAPIIQMEEAPSVEISNNFANLPPLLKGVGAGELTLYEGLPSEFWESQTRERELQSQKCIRLLGHPFYELQLTLNEEDAKRLTQLLSMQTSFRAFRSQKQCAGFHADYCLEWATPEAVTQAIVSLECEEIILSGPAGALKCDLGADVAAELKSLLGQYQQSRPVPEAGP